MNTNWNLPSVLKIRVKGTPLALILVAMGTVSSCTSPITPPQEPKPPLLIAVNSEQTEKWLEAAYNALVNDDPVSPKGRKAFEYYEKVLAVDPENVEAQRGIGKIAELFMEKAADAIEKHYWPTARSMLDRAYVVKPGQPGIKTMRQQIETLSSAKVHEFKLDSRQTRSRDAITAKILQNIGELARSPKTRVFVRASNDSEGRWIFQQLNKSSGGGVIRGEIQIGRPPLIRILELQTN